MRSSSYSYIWSATGSQLWLLSAYQHYIIAKFIFTFISTYISHYCKAMRAQANIVINSWCWEWLYVGFSRELIVENMIIEGKGHMHVLIVWPAQRYCNDLWMTSAIYSVCTTQSSCSMITWVTPCLTLMRVFDNKGLLVQTYK